MRRSTLPGVNGSNGTVNRLVMEHRNSCWSEWGCFLVSGASSSKPRLLFLFVLTSLAASVFTGCQPCPSAPCTCAVDTTTPVSFPIVGKLSLVFTSKTRWPLVFDVLNFTAVIQTGVPQQYEWTSSDNWTSRSVEPYVQHQYTTSGHHSMTVNVSNTLGYRTASVNFTVYRRTEASLTYFQVPQTAVVDQTFVMSVSVEARAYSLLNCLLFLDDELIRNASSDADATTSSHDRYAVWISIEARLVVSGKHRVTLLAADVVTGNLRTFVWYIDAFDAILDVTVEFASPAIATGFSTTFSARHRGGSAPVTYLWDFGDQSATVDTGVNASSPAHAFTRPGTYTVRVTASNSVSRVTGSADLNVVDAIAGVMLAYDGPTPLGRDTFIKAVVRSGTEVMYNFSTPGATTLARSQDAVMMRYSTAGQHEVTVVVRNAVSNGFAFLVIYVVDASTLIVLGVSNATCGLPLHSVVTFNVDVVCANTSDLVFHWLLLPDVLELSGRGLDSVSATFRQPGVYELTVSAWNHAVGVRDEYRQVVCANETVGLPEDSSFDLGRPSIGVSLISAPYLPAQHDVCFFPVMRRCSTFICSFDWVFWDSAPPTTMHGFTVQYQFRNLGVYNVSLVVRRMHLIRKTTYTTVTVQRRIDSALLQAAVETSGTDEPIVFVVTIQPNDIEAAVLTYHWSFYDNPKIEYIGNSSQMTYAFQREGVRRVEVSVSNNVSAVTAGASVSVYSQITGLTFTGCCRRVFNTSVQFEASVQTGLVTGYQWTLQNDDGVTRSQGTKRVFVHKFAATGNYQIQLTARNPLSNQTVVDYFTVQVSVLAVLCVLYIHTRILSQIFVITMYVLNAVK